MTEFFNPSDSGVRYGPDDRRLPPHGLVSVEETSPEGEALASNPVVREATEADREAYADSLRGPDDTRTADEVLASMAGGARVLARAASVAAPLQKVIGDDDAPLGPPTGTISTKQVEAQRDPQHKAAFADHEHVNVPEGASATEKAQAAATRGVEGLAQEILGDPEDVELNPTKAFADVDIPAPEGTPEGVGAEQSSDSGATGDGKGTNANGDDNGDGLLEGEALAKRAQDLNIEGRSKMNAEELRAAVAEAEAKQSE